MPFDVTKFLAQAREFERSLTNAERWITYKDKANGSLILAVAKGLADLFDAVQELQAQVTEVVETNNTVPTPPAIDICTQCGEERPIFKANKKGQFCEECYYKRFPMARRPA